MQFAAGILSDFLNQIIARTYYLPWLTVSAAISVTATVLHWDRSRGTERKTKRRRGIVQARLRHAGRTYDVDSSGVSERARVAS